MHIKIKSTDNRVEIAGTMTDISFLLIIFFIITAVFFADKGLFLKLPDKKEKPIVLTSDQVILIQIASKGIIRIDNQNIEPIAVANEIKNRLNEKPGLVVILKVAGEVNYQKVLSVIEEAKKGGATRFSIISFKNKPIPIEIEKARK